MRLPDDLRQVVKKRIIKKLSLFFALLIFLGGVLLLFGDRLFNTDVVAFKVSCYVCVMLLPFVITGVPFCLIDSSWYGEIVRVDIEEAVEATRESKPRLYGALYTVITVKKSNGRLITKEIKQSNFSMYKGLWGASTGIAVSARERKNEHFCDDYRVGDTVFHLYGSYGVVVLPRSSSEQVRCAVCGDQCLVADEHCGKCGSTLVKKIQ